MKDTEKLVERAQRGIFEYISQHPDCNLLPKEQDLVEILGVSRVVVREALSSLRTLGFIETRRKKGTEVVKPEVFGILKKMILSGLLDKETLRDLYQLRIMLEIGMADFIFLNRSEEQMSHLEDLMVMENSIRDKRRKENDPEEKLALAKELTAIDVDFHSTLFHMTGNKSLVDFQHVLQHLFTLYFPSPEDRDIHEQTIVSHIGLFNILRTGNPESFRMAMRMHLQRQLDSMERVLENTSNK